MKLAIAFIASICALTSNVSAAPRAGRPMIIHRLPELNLEIWTEQDPQWETHLIETDGAFTFSAETPALTYPPAHMSWTTQPRLKFQQHEIEAGVRGALHQVAALYRAAPPTQIQLKTYGELVGYEAVLHGRSEKVPIDVRVFCGHRPGRAAVVMQAVTLKDKLPHLSEHIRRSWNNVRYLD